MKLRQEDNLVLSNGTGEKKFTIAATARAFQILSSALYSRKVEAIVRELSCNAYDSHVQAGCADRPFAIYLPNEWESEFAVEDFGIGLDDDAVMNIYTSYFTSTKTDSNEVIGGLGLGSKTPFAYTDSFNIRARKDGVERTYNAYISSSGEPSVSLLTEHATTEPNGVKVTVPVRAGDRQQFIDDCIKVHRWFSVKPEYHGYSGVLNVDNAVLADIEEHGHVIINARNCVHYTGAYSYSDFVRVLMGNVSYFVSNIRSQFGDHLGDGEKSFFANNGMILKFNIGDLDVAASRETISFDEISTQVFVDKVKETLRNGFAVFQEEVDACKSFIDAYKLVENKYGTWAHHIVEYKGASLYDLGEYKIAKLVKHIVEDTGEVNRVEDVMFRRGSKNSVHYLSATFKDLSLNPSGSRKVVILEGVTRSYVRHARNLSDRRANWGCFVVRKPLTEFQRNAFIEEFGEVEFVDGIKLHADELEEARRQRAATRKANAAKRATATSEPVVRMKRSEARVAAVYKLENDDVVADYNLTAGVLVSEDDVAGKKYAVLEINRGKIVYPQGFEGDQLYTSDDNDHIYAFMTVTGLDVLVLAKPAQREKLDKVLVSPRVDVGAMFTVVSKKCKLDMTPYLLAYVRAFGSNILDNIHCYSWLDTVLGEGSIIDQPELAVVKTFQERINTPQVQRLCRARLHYALGWRVSNYTLSPFHDKIIDYAKACVKKVSDRIATRYPLLPYGSGASFNDEAAAAYIALVDELNELKALQQKDSPV